MNGISYHLPSQFQKLGTAATAWEGRPTGPGQTLAFVNGCFDLFHEGHRLLLEQARMAADVLILAVNSDASVRRRKGLSRPIQPAWLRLQVAAHSSHAAWGIVFDDDDPQELMKALCPDVYVLGSDYRNQPIPGVEFCGRVLFVERLPGISTTTIIKGRCQAEAMA